MLELATSSSTCRRVETASLTAETVVRRLAGARDALQVRERNVEESVGDVAERVADAVEAGPQVGDLLPLQIDSVASALQLRLAVGNGALEPIDLSVEVTDLRLIRTLERS